MRLVALAAAGACILSAGIHAATSPATGTAFVARPVGYQQARTGAKGKQTRFPAGGLTMQAQPEPMRMKHSEMPPPVAQTSPYNAPANDDTTGVLE